MSRKSTDVYKCRAKSTYVAPKLSIWRDIPNRSTPCLNQDLRDCGCLLSRAWLGRRRLVLYESLREFTRVCVCLRIV